MAAAAAPMNKIIITGGLGFLGQNLCRAIVRTQSHPVAITLVDQAPTAAPTSSAWIDTLLKESNQHATIDVVYGDISNPSFCQTIVGSSTSSIFHLAAAMSGACEQDIALGLKTNLQGTLNLLEAVRTGESRGARFIFASTGAVFGTPSSPTSPTSSTSVITDAHKFLPETSYGTTKSMCELLVNDYNRRGDVVGRSARLPTVVVRPGAPNAATTGIFSGVVREALNGESCASPLPLDVPHAVTSHRTAILSMLALHDISETEFIKKVPHAGSDRGVNVHSITTTLQALNKSAKRSATGSATGEESGWPTVDVEVDAQLTEMVSSMPDDLGSDVASLLQLPGEQDTVDTLVAHYVEDFVDGDGINGINGTNGMNGRMNGRERGERTLGKERDGAAGLTVGFVGVGNMGSGMLLNLLQHSNDVTTIKVYNRTKEKVDQLLDELQQKSMANMENIHIDVVDTPTEASLGCDITMLCLGNEQICSDILLGGNGRGTA